jgi:acyl carrier protein
MKTDRPTLVATVLTLLRAIAPELDPEALELARPLRQQVDLDSMDWLNFLVSLHERFGVEIAESDYARLISLNDVVDYLQARLD